MFWNVEIHPLGLSSHDSIVLVSCPHLLADTRIMTSEASLLAPNRGPSTQDIRVWILNISSVELHCGGILWYSSILFEETEALHFPLFLPLFPSPLSFCLSEPSVPPADTPFFSVLSLQVRRTSSLNSWGQRWRVSPCGGDWHIYFWSLDFGPDSIFISSYGTLPASHGKPLTWVSVNGCSAETQTLLSCLGINQPQIQISSVEKWKELIRCPRCFSCILSTG